MAAETGLPGTGASLQRYPGPQPPGGLSRPRPSAGLRREEERAMTRILRAMTAGLSLLAVALGAWSSAGAQGKELVMGNVNPPKHGTSQAAQQLDRKSTRLNSSH